jgi:hypothetical protein
MKVTRLTAISTGRLYPQRLSRIQDLSAAGRIKSKNISNDSFGNRTLDLPDCSTVLQTTVAPCATSAV